MIVKKGRRYLSSLKLTLKTLRCLDFKVEVEDLSWLNPCNGGETEAR